MNVTTIPLVHRISRELNEAVERIDREHITAWLMRFSADLPIAFDHPQIGQIRFSGIASSGSVVDVYDRYVKLVIDDPIAETTVQVEDGFVALARQDRGGGGRTDDRCVEWRQTPLGEPSVRDQRRATRSSWPWRF